jgi:hypothetical protein
MRGREFDPLTMAERLERAIVLRDTCAPMVAELGIWRRTGPRELMRYKPVGTALGLELTHIAFRKEWTLSIYVAGNQQFFIE